MFELAGRGRANIFSKILPSRRTSVCARYFCVHICTSRVPSVVVGLRPRRRYSLKWTGRHLTHFFRTGEETHQFCKCSCKRSCNICRVPTDVLLAKALAKALAHYPTVAHANVPARAHAIAHAQVYCERASKCSCKCLSRLSRPCPCNVHANDLSNALANLDTHASLEALVKVHKNVLA